MVSELGLGLSVDFVAFAAVVFSDPMVVSNVEFSEYEIVSFDAIVEFSEFEIVSFDASVELSGSAVVPLECVVVGVRVVVSGGVANRNVKLRILAVVLRVILKEKISPATHESKNIGKTVFLI